ncbi:MAG: zinc ribbon domain-containing protein [Lachnospiraceae bacterium]|nr:zinc ribbon domain-containing protein [Lachnospiraceae bacterium]
MKKKFALLLALLLTVLLIPTRPAAAKATDEIIKYTVTVDVNDDATLNMLYHIEWKVLDDSIGTVSWLHIGIPNSHYISCDPISNNIDHIKMDISSYSSYADVYFTREYKEDETISFDFKLVQDYMYEMNILKEGESVYYFTPGWFDGVAIDELVIDWNADKAIANSHGATPENGRLIWKGSLSADAKFGEISVTYPSDAFAFDSSKTVRSDGSYSDGNYSYDDSDDEGSAFLGFIFLVIIIVVVVKVVKSANDYSSGSGFNSTTTTKKKITRTLIKYYPTCPGCGAARPENAETCEYCGRSFIESEEVVEEKEIKNPEKYQNEGTFHYGSSQNTYMRVHVTHIPVVRSAPTRSSSCVHSSCAHSSCACAHSCACACACACAGGGRAGCSTKDFYNTNLKLSQLKRKIEGK